MKLAAIDIGTNSIHMLLVEVQNRGFEIVDREKTMVKLGQGVFRSGRLSERAFTEGVNVVRRYCKLAESLGVTDIIAVATSAVREAQNGGDFLRAIHECTGVDPRVISGAVEARLIFLAVRHAIDIGEQRVLIFDIGGGSVEAVVADKTRLLLTESLRLGVQRLLDRHGGSEPLSGKEQVELRDYIRGDAADFFTKAKEFGYSKVIGTSGTVRTLCEATHLTAGGAAWNSTNAQVARRRDIKELAKRLADMTEAERAGVPGIARQRADAIHFGAVLLSHLMELAEAEEITVCEASLRDGLILDYLDPHGSNGTHKPVFEPRRRSVLELMYRYDREDPHERHVADLALQLFDQSKTLHQLGEPERELLEYAALLHGVGQHVNFRGRHKHGAYIVRHSPLRGFTDQEIEELSLVVKFHRRLAPDSGNTDLARLPKPRARVIRLLSSILRVAVALDRGDTQVVKAVRLRESNGKLELLIAGDRDLELELWAARRKLKPLSRALRAGIAVRRDDSQ
ncbi:MAG TPA: Ppx/GppA phosphatase family protein [Polyangiaceae bacterium]